MHNIHTTQLNKKFNTTKINLLGGTYLDALKN